MSYIVNVEEREYKIDLTKEAGGYVALIDGKKMNVEVAREDGDEIIIVVNNRPYVIMLESDVRIRVNGDVYEVNVMDEQIQKLIKASPEKFQKKDLALKAVMPGLVIDIMVKEGDPVKTGDALLVLEAMKMQNELKAPQDGTVKRVIVQKGKTVNTGDTLLVIE